MGFSVAIRRFVSRFPISRSLCVCVHVTWSVIGNNCLLSLSPLPRESRIVMVNCVADVLCGNLRL